jgi:hypothetical protein
MVSYMLWPLPPEERVPGTHWREIGVDTRACLNLWSREISLLLPQIKALSSSLQPVITDSAIPVQGEINTWQISPQESRLSDLTYQKKKISLASLYLFHYC